VNHYTALFPFCGLGAGALGFLQAQADVLGVPGRFRSVGGIDLDAEACADFERLTGSPALCTDIGTMTPALLRAFVPEAPDAVFASPPCKGLSALLSRAKSKEPKYQALNQLALDWVRLMLGTWDELPKLFLLENVPRITTRGAELLAEVRRLMAAAGYVFHEATHDCGELGGLAQHRRRFLLVARHPKQVPPLLYQPHKRQVRACGEVLEQLPMPEDPAAGAMHRMPRISWLNWVRLALIPAGGDWRDLPGVLETGQARREVHRRHHVGRWDQPVATVAGSGSNGPSAVADPRPRRWYSNVYKVTRWTDPACTVTGAAKPSSGAFSVADPRVRVAYDHGYGVLRWGEPSSTVAAGSHPGQGAYSVADPRLDCEPHAGAYGVIPWEEAAKTVTGTARIDNGPWAVTDPRRPDAPPIIVIENVRKAPPMPPIIIAADGTWHRPLTTLELAALQGLPTTLDGEPLQLAGNSVSRHRERIGNAVPTPTARAIAEQMLQCLLSADGDSFTLSTNMVWVAPRFRRVPQLQVVAPTTGGAP